MGQHQTSKTKIYSENKRQTTNRKQMPALVSKSFHTRPGTWTQNLKIRSLARYPITPAGPVEPLRSFINMILQHQEDWFWIRMGTEVILIRSKSLYLCLYEMYVLLKPPQFSRMKANIQLSPLQEKMHSTWSVLELCLDVSIELCVEVLILYFQNKI